MGRSVHPHIITPDSAMLGESYGIDIPRSLRFNTNNGGNQYLTKNSGEINQEKILEFIYPQIPNFDEQPEDYRNQIIQRVKDHMRSKEYSAETFENFSLQGTPSVILVDRKGILRDVSFGQTGHIDGMIQQILSED